MNQPENNQQLLIQEEYSLLNSDPKEKIEKLADYIARVLDPYKDNVYYFTLPLWNYEEKKWLPNTVGRFYHEPAWEKNSDAIEQTTAYKQYVKFFKEAQQYFSFIEFFTNDIDKLTPQFSINFCTNEFSLSDNRDCIFFKKSSNINDEQDKNIFIGATSKLLENMEVSEKERMLGNFYRFLCAYEKHYNSISNIYLFPSLLFKSDESDRYVSSGGVILVCKKPINDVALFQRISIISNLCFREIGGKNWAKVSRNETIKSAKAAIMSRNMSHNLGSHVMSYLKNHLGSVQDVLNDRVLSRLINNRSDLDDLFGRGKLEENELTLPFLVGLGQFISYLQERQDFIATIATDYVPYYATINFKDSIYDVLNNDKRFERHQDRKNLKPDNILLGNIARSEGLARRTCPTSDDNSSLSDIVIKFRSTFTGDPVEVISASGNNETIQPEMYYGDKVEKAKEQLNEMRKYEVSLPGGIVGRQAVFSIIENVIRNAAKHGNWRQQGKLELTIDIFSKEDVLKSDTDKGLQERLRDDRADNESLSLKEVLKKYYCSANSNEDDYFFVTLTDNLNVSSNSLKSLRKALIEGYIDEDSRMIDANKGIKEMRISAAWLRSINDDIALSPFDESNYIYMVEDRKWLGEGMTWDKQPPVLYARLSKAEEGGNNNLQYIFCLMRPKRVAFVSPSFSDISNVKTRLKEMGWYLFTPSEFLDYKNKSFEIVVYNDTDSDTELMNQVKRYSPKRFVRLSEVKERAIFDKLIGAQGDGKEPVSISDEEVDDAFVSLYKYLSDWDETINEMIFIHDIKAQNNYNGLTEDKRSDKITFEERENAKYRYVTHLESKNEFSKYVVSPDTPNGFVFSEGITGDNSTDRLVRNEELTDLWFFKHLYVMKQNVAIFDERIFSKVYGLEENDLVIPPIENFGVDIRADQDALKKIFLSDTDHEVIDQLTTHDLLKNFVEKKIAIIERKEDANMDKEFKYDPKLGYDFNAVDARNHKGTTYAFKGLYIFTIIRSVELPGMFNIYGYQYAPETPEFSRCVKYATIGWDKDNKIPKINFEKNIDRTALNSLSIHQGLLDKLYGVFGIKNIKKEKERIEAKENLTKVFYEEFVVEPAKQAREDRQNVTSVSPIEFEEKDNEVHRHRHYYLPGMIIHSGRSKPSKEDMPQWLPFIPYSAIEHAVNDCKYSIVELLDSARYE